jgi:hypothetical protein
LADWIFGLTRRGDVKSDFDYFIADREWKTDGCSRPLARNSRLAKRLGEAGN